MLSRMTKQELVKLLTKLTQNGRIDEIELQTTNIELYVLIQQIRLEIKRRK